VGYLAELSICSERLEMFSFPESSRMAGFGHEAAEAEVVDPATAARNARYGLVLFVLYFAFYALFVVLNAFLPSAMSISVGGINLAVAYGMGLIVAALVLALIYCWLCRGGVETNSAGREAASGVGQ
jgi:uncharacterized membrane protein (DUF485 family)